VRTRKVIETIVVGGIVLVPLGVLSAFAYVKSGLFNVAASRPHTAFTEWVTHETMIHSVRRRAQGVADPPQRFGAVQVIAGFCQYEAHCVACHGAAGVARAQWVSGLEPAPPYLLDVHQRFQPRELFWIVRNGIKMTAMPAWRDSMSDGEIWNTVAYLEASAKMPPQTYVNWRRVARCSR
jgi:mono/diheme cytochrome c family protein